MRDQNSTFSVSDGELSAWVDQETIHIKAIDKFGDPVELTKQQALELADALSDWSPISPISLGPNG